jgi:hypothetical protein
MKIIIKNMIYNNKNKKIISKLNRKNRASNDLNVQK